jgi:hypothetical protein
MNIGRAVMPGNSGYLAFSARLRYLNKHSMPSGSERTSRMARAELLHHANTMAGHGLAVNHPSITRYSLSCLACNEFRVEAPPAPETLHPEERMALC